jgi:hypothetical protein
MRSEGATTMMQLCCNWKNWALLLTYASNNSEARMNNTGRHADKVLDAPPAQLVVNTISTKSMGSEQASEYEEEKYI